MDYSQHFRRGHTPQTEQADPAQVKNSAGGYSFEVDNWKRLERFLILGSERGSYYTRERELTRENAKAVDACLTENPVRAVRTIAVISKAGRAPKNDPAIFALSLAASHPSPVAKREAMKALGEVCRTGTHLFQFVEMVSKQRGWGRGLRAAVAGWYGSKEPQQLMYQLAKYRQRNGWFHRDVLRKCHWHPSTKELEAVARWVVGAELGQRSLKRGDKTFSYLSGQLPEYLQAFDELQKTDSKARVIELIDSQRFTHEMLPSQWLNDQTVWEALLPDMPLGALVRNLGKLTAIELVKPMSKASQRVVEKLSNTEVLRKSRLHPLAILTALQVYRQGCGQKGSLSWRPVAQVMDALDDAFYAAFDHVVPTGKRRMLALDVSGSMEAKIAGSPLSCREASAAMAMVTARTESNYMFLGFSDRRGSWGTGVSPLEISAKQRLDDVVRYISRLPFGGTDCALPMLHAMAEGLDVESFDVYTDSETWHGTVHPHEALRQYRQRTGIAAKLAVVGMVSNGFTIADPTDAGMLDVVGFDTATPNVLADFAREG